MTGDPLIMPDPSLNYLGQFYRMLCVFQGNEVLMRGRRVVTFEQFVRDRTLAEHIKIAVMTREARKAARVIPKVEAFPI